QAEEAGDPLSIALWSCLYSGFHSLTVETARKAWSLNRGGFEELEPRSSVNGLCIRMHRARQSGFWNSFKLMLRGRVTESVILRDRLERCHLPVELDGRVINRSAEKVSIRERVLLRLHLMGPAEAAPDQIFGGNFGLAQAKLTFRNTVKLESPANTWTTFAAMQKPADPTLFRSSWRPATYMGSGRVLAELLLPLEDRSRQELAFVKHGVEVGRVRFPLRGSVSALGVDVDASGLSLIKNDRLERFLGDLYNAALGQLKGLSVCELPEDIARVIHSL
ncbi:MAG: hypothetical protein KC800_18480, partial [Candidatus Eremiobacteraeota bacterium]|nr:hypothetical protein [Candidatus Eremiobacteraeota bacterium]